MNISTIPLELLEGGGGGGINCCPCVLVKLYEASCYCNVEFLECEGIIVEAGIVIVANVYWVIYGCTIDEGYLQDK